MVVLVPDNDVGGTDGAAAEEVTAAAVGAAAAAADDWDGSDGFEGGCGARGVTCWDCHFL